LNTPERGGKGNQRQIVDDAIGGEEEVLLLQKGEPRREEKKKGKKGRRGSGSTAPVPQSRLQKRKRRGRVTELLDCREGKKRGEGGGLSGADLSAKEPKRSALLRPGKGKGKKGEQTSRFLKYPCLTYGTRGEEKKKPQDSRPIVADWGEEGGKREGRRHSPTWRVFV